jgi:hypothetical protein
MRLALLCKHGLGVSQRGPLCNPLRAQRKRRFSFPQVGKLGVVFRNCVPSNRSRTVRPQLRQRPFHALKHRRRQPDDPDAVALFRLDPYRNTTRLGKRIRDDFEFLAVKANILLGPIPETLHTSTDFYDRRRFIRMAGHDVSILPWLQAIGKARAPVSPV